MSSGNWQKYRNTNPLQQKLMQNFLHTVARMVQKASPETLLDVGCAEGFVLNHIRTYTGNDMEMTGVDLDTDALRRGSELFPELALHQGNLFSLPFEADSFDLVICLEVLEHQTDPSNALQCIQRVSNEYCLLSVPFEPFFCLGNMLRLKNLKRFGNDPEHVQHWHPGTFKRFLRKHDLEIVEASYPLPWMVFLVKKIER